MTLTKHQQYIVRWCMEHQAKIEFQNETTARIWWRTIRDIKIGSIEYWLVNDSWIPQLAFMYGRNKNATIFEVV